MTLILHNSIPKDLYTKQLCIVFNCVGQYNPQVNGFSPQFVKQYIDALSNDFCCAYTLRGAYILIYFLQCICQNKICDLLESFR